MNTEPAEAAPRSRLRSLHHARRPVCPTGGPCGVELCPTTFYPWRPQSAIAHQLQACAGPQVTRSGRRMRVSRLLPYGLSRYEKRLCRGGR
jgi:hypothetical protein